MYLITPFAKDGDRDVLPQNSPEGRCNLSKGWGGRYEEVVQLDPEMESDPNKLTQGLDISRREFNGIFFLITSILKHYQENCYPEWISPQDNEGNPFKYRQNVIVSFNNNFYRSKVSDNTAPPTNTDNWEALSGTVKAISMDSVETFDLLEFPEGSYELSDGVYTNAPLMSLDVLSAVLEVGATRKVTIFDSESCWVYVYNPNTNKWCAPNIGMYTTLGDMKVGE